MTDTQATSPAPRELTLRSVLLGAALTAVFTAANVYLGLKIGLTFATSIPAAVISMAVLRQFSGATIQENNIVQTIASAAGTLSAIIFVLPGLIMIGWWVDFPYWQSVAVIGVGGILGVMYSVPLRRALVTGSDLPYPEGVAAAEVLKVGAGLGGEEENRKGLAAIVAGSAASVGYTLLAKLGLVAEEAAKVFRVGAGASGVSTSFSLALIGVGHLVGLTVGLAMLAGMLISWVVLVPHFTVGGPPVGTELASFVSGVFRQKVRFIGAGTIGVAAVYTLLRVIGPIVRGIAGALAAQRARKAGQGAALALTEQDLPIGLVGMVIAASMVPIGFLLAGFAQGGPIEQNFWPVLLCTIAYVLVIGVVIASVCGYMAGLIGASNSPVSGTGILSALGIALLLAVLFGRNLAPEATRALVAFALFVTALIFGVATISNDNLQDLKTGELIGATPWRQQVALVLGVVFGALVIPPILSLLNSTFGFQGAAGAGPEALAAPQAALISAIAQGVLGGGLDWGLIGLGAGIGVVAIIVDEVLRATKKGALPPLALGMGIYLPMALTLLIPVGAIIGWFYDRWAHKAKDPALAERLGVLAATGLIAGESLFGVVFAGIAAARNSPTPLEVVEGFPLALPLGMALFAGLIGWLYSRTKKAGTL
ncbi:oligopeptide transporter, OPT family [Novosphingobium umbonatum]|uniref:Oligopeptide transporter, OPT family n=1 Tax=Novosphingobium umbonatum TaxID=1908524 RepID=A0A3S2V887_9SPHN|nr:oligopeptide transporter, OPT family [Novosphingobium umbonatum]RVU06151.1 oligopeptide transporter, OPT family [Novosphingobium umbonatum]